MVLNAVIRCNTCGKISKKFGSKDGNCAQCVEIEQLREENQELKKIVSIFEDQIGNTKNYINLFAEELGYYFYQIKSRLKGEA